MIETDEQLQQAWQALGDLYRTLASYRAKTLPANPRNYAIIAQGPQNQIRKLQAEIDEYLGLREPAAIGESVLRETPSGFDKDAP